MTTSSLSLKNIRKSCDKYREERNELESCFPTTIRSIKQVYRLLNECRRAGTECPLTFAFVKSYLLAIEEANTRFETGLDTYVEDVLRVKTDDLFRIDVATGKVRGDVSGSHGRFRKRGAVADGFYIHYKNYYDFIDRLQETFHQIAERHKRSPTEDVITFAALDQLIKDYTTATLSICEYVRRNDRANAGAFCRETGGQLRKTT